MNDSGLPEHENTMPRIASILACIVGGICVILALWMRFTIRGTRLLLIEASSGRHYRNWSTLLILGLILFLGGLIAYSVLHRRHGGKKPAMLPTQDASALPASPADDSAVPASDGKPADATQDNMPADTNADTPLKPKFCPECGKPVAEGSLFCQSCGTKLG